MFAFSELLMIDDPSPPQGESALPSDVKVSSDFEREKFAFEREKLRFEMSKFDAEQAKRDKELEKLEEEIREYKRPLWRKSGSFGAYATVVVAIIAGLLTFGTDVFKSNIAKLLSDRKTLREAVAKLATEESRLRRDSHVLLQTNSDLISDRASLQEQQAVLETKQQELLKANQILGLQKEELSRDVSLAPVKTRISLIDSSDGFQPFPLMNVDEGSIRAVLDFAETHKGDSGAIDFLLKQFNVATSNVRKATLALALYEATGDLKWKEELKTATKKDLDQGYSVGSHFHVSLNLLGTPDLLTSVEKAEILKAAYPKLIGQKVEPNSISETKQSDSLEMRALRLDIQSSDEELRKLRDEGRYFEICELARWDKEATLAFREPWLACRDYLVGQLLTPGASTSSEKDSVGQQLYDLSHQIYVIAILESVRLYGSSSYQDGQIALPRFATSKEKICTTFDVKFPLCVDWISHQNPTEPDPYLRIRFGSLPAYKQWLVDNRELSSALLGPEHKTLLAVDDSTMSKLFDGEWITIADLHHP